MNSRFNSLCFLQQKTNLWSKKPSPSNQRPKLWSVHSLQTSLVCMLWVLMLLQSCESGLSQSHSGVPVWSGHHSKSSIWAAETRTQPYSSFTSDTFHCKRQIEKRKSETGEKRRKNKTKAWFRLTGKCQCVRNFPARKAN